MRAVVSREQTEALFKRALAAAKADDVVLALGGGRLVAARIAPGCAPAIRVEHAYVLEARLRLRGAIGVARTTRVDPAGVDAVVAEARARATEPPAGHALMPLGEARVLPEPKTFDPAIATLPPEGLVALLAPIVLEARAAGVELEATLAARAGAIGLGGDPGLLAMASSRGFFHFHRTTRVWLELRALAGGGAARVELAHWFLRAFDPRPALSRAILRARLHRDPKPLPPGPETVLLEPAALAPFLLALAPHFSADAVAESRSFLRGRVGRGIARANITLRDDAAHPLHGGLPYDGEGQPRRAVTLIDRGLVRDFTYSRAQAWRESVAPTGHAPFWPERGDARPRHLVLEGQKHTHDDLVRSIPKGVLISAVSGHRVLDPSRAVCAGTTTGGTYRIEGGRVRHALSDLRYEMSAFDVLAFATRLSQPERAGDVVAPALVSRDFRLLGATS